MNALIPSGLKPAYTKCETLAFSHYENFPVASLLLPASVRPHVAALYAFSRTADDLSDEPQYEGRRLGLLRAWERDFQKALQGNPAPLELQAFAHTVKSFDIPIKLPLDLLKAFRMDLTVHRYPTWEKLLFYCRHSADPVGRMVLLINGIRDEKLHRYSDFICSGLQLINFWQDTSIDVKKGRLYYPLCEIKRRGVRPSDLLSGKDSPAVRLLVKDAVAYTRDFFQKGLPLLSALSGRLRLEVKATYLGGLGILKKIEGMDYNVLQQRPSWTGGEKLALGLKALFLALRP